MRKALQIVRCINVYLCRREVEVTELFGPDHQDVSVVGFGWDPVDLDHSLSSGDVKVVGAETHFAQDNVGGGVVAHIVQAVVDHHVLALDQVFVLDLYFSGGRDEEKVRGVLASH